MRTCFCITFLLIAVAFNANSQSISERKDSLKIDSIKKQLPKLKDIERIKSMIVLCEYYSDKTKAQNINAIDSIRYYGNRILNESKPISYKKGIAMGILTTAPDSLKEKKAREAIKIGEESGDEEVLGWAYVVLSTTSRDMKQNTAHSLQAIDHLNKAGKILRAVFINTWVCQGYFGSGENEKAFDCARKNLEALKTIQVPEFSYIYSQSLLWNYWNMCEIFSAAGDYEEALKYIRKTGEVDKADDPSADDWTLDISGIYAALGNYDSAMLYWQRFRNVPNWDDPNWSWRPGKKLSYNYLAGLYKMNKQYDTAIGILKDNIVYFDSLL
ncbi:MAG TPA: tetratricopeptide repeat protein, partial [Chitinophagaceae bacterium]|nr:tetratricopeptide repeat protein [Chitinophagaceae bacterium]